MSVLIEKSRDVIKKESPARFYAALMLLSSLLVSTSFIVGELITHQIDPLLLTFIRFAVGGTILGLIVVLRGEFFFSVSLLLRAAIISSCLVIFFWSMFLALRYTSALNTSVIFALTPLFSAIYSLLLLQESFKFKRFAALIYGGLGALWVLFQGDIGNFAAMSWNRGDLIFLGGCAAMGFYAPLIKLLHEGESMLLMTFWVLITGGAVLLLFSIPILVEFQPAQLQTSTWLWVLYLSTVTTVITFYLVQLSIPYLGPVKVTSYSYLYPALLLGLELVLGYGLPEFAVWPGVIIVVSAMFFIRDDAGNTTASLPQVRRGQG